MPLLITELYEMIITSHELEGSENETVIARDFSDHLEGLMVGT
jgi:hypothetical protein